MRLDLVITWNKPHSFMTIKNFNVLHQASVTNKLNEQATDLFGCKQRVGYSGHCDGPLSTCME